MSPVTGFIIFCRLEDGNLTDSRLCRRFPILIPFARRFKNRRLFICLSALVFQTFSLDKKNLRSLCLLSKCREALDCILTGCKKTSVFATPGPANTSVCTWRVPLQYMRPFRSCHICTSIRWWHCVYHTVTRITSFRCISHLLVFQTFF